MCIHMGDKFYLKDAKNSNFNEQMGFRKKSNLFFAEKKGCGELYDI